MTTAAAVADELLARFLADGRAPGAALVATDRGAVVLERYVGLADVAAGRPVDAGTAFQIGSITKVVTALLVLREHRAGRVDLHAPVRSYLPWLPERPYATRTPYQLLSHTAGLPPGSDLSPDSPYMALSAVVPDAAEPGSFAYSDAGFQVLGLLLEAVTGRPYPELVRRALLEPLGMASSHPAITHDNRAAQAVAYVGSHDDRTVEAGHGLVPARYFTYGAADGSMVCTARDLAAFAAVLADRGAGVLDAEGWELFSTPVADVDDVEQMCLGVFREDGVLNHGGSMVGFEAVLYADPAAG
ncbi:MAG TPA: serine hydrolase domain-containing protein, partial [Pseudonocardiaceae bacterium]